MRFTSKEHATDLFNAVKSRIDTMLEDAVVTVHNREFEDKSDFYASVLEQAALRIRAHSAHVKATTL